MAENASLTFANWGYRHASRHHFAVRGLQLHIEAGQRVLLLGASGIGKSTILEGAAGLLGDDSAAAQPQPLGVEQSADSDAVRTRVDAEGGTYEGVVLVDGTEVHQARGSVGLVLQDPDSQAIFQRLGDNVAFGPENMNIPREQIWADVRTSLASVGLEGMQLHRSTAHLSGGQMQRLALAGALAMRPKVLLLDEPTANLDPDGVEQIVGAVRHVVDAQHSTMVLVEHRAEPWIDMIDRVIILGLQTEEHHDVRLEQDEFSQEINRTDFARTVVVADGTPDAVFTDNTLDFSALGIWVPQRYAPRREAIVQTLAEENLKCEVRSGNGQVVLTTSDLSIGRGGNSIAEHIELEFTQGEITALVGPNGAGKSTLALTLAGLLESVSGSVVASETLAQGLLGTNPIEWKSSDLASRISYVFQNPEHQFATGSVLEEVMLGPVRTGSSQEEAHVRAMELLTRFHLDQYAHANPYTLSGGEKRRLTVASALAAKPRVMILDEPTFGQDRQTWGQMVRLILELRTDGVSIIVVTHDSDLVTALGARLVVLQQRESHLQHAELISHMDESAADSVKIAPVTMPDEASMGTEQGVEKNGEINLEKDEIHTEKDVGVRLHQCAAVSPSNEMVIDVSSVRSRDEKPRESSHSRYLASLNPAYRLVGAFIVSIPLLLSLDWVSAAVALCLELVILFAIGFTPKSIVRATWPIFVGAPGSAIAVLLYGKQGGAVWWHWGMITVTDRSAMLALATGIRILAIGVPAIIAVIGIDATDLADSFSQIFHLPDRFVYGGLAGMRLFSVLQDDWAALSASRRSRGLGDDNKFRSFFPQSFALLVLSIRRSTMLATAMQARGFGSLRPRSHARVSAVHYRDRVFLVCCAVIPAVALLATWWNGTFNLFGG